MKSGWETKKLGGLCSFLNRGVSPKYVENGGIAVLNQKCVRDHHVSLEFGRRHDAKAKNVSSERLLQIGDVLVNSTGTGTLGRVAQLRANPPEPTTVDSHVTIVRPLPGLFVREFFGYMLWDIEDELKESGEGCGGQTELNRSVLAEKFLVRFPKSLSEQQRFVGILDKVFERIVIAKDNAEKNLQNARALFASHLQSVFSRCGPGWTEKTLSDVCEFENGDRGKNYPNRKEYVEFGIPWINTGHIQPDGTLSTEEMNFITRKKFNSLRSGKIQPGDLVYCLRGATLGKTAIVDPLTEGAVASSLVIIRPKALLDSRFLYFFLTSPPGQGLIKGFENGAAQPNLGAKSVAKYPISFPTLTEQKGIADKLAELREETQGLATLYDRKLAALEALKKSMLHQAFTGRL
jgi:type I restriction enzyme S subunit